MSKKEYEDLLKEVIEYQVQKGVVDIIEQNFKIWGSAGGNKDLVWAPYDYKEKVFDVKELEAEKNLSESILKLIVDNKSNKK